MSERHPDKIYHERVVKLCELSEDDGTMDGYELTGCHVKGPALLLPSTGSSLEGFKIVGDVEAALWEVPEEKTNVSGIVVATDCTFENCTFYNVGFVGHPYYIEKIRQGFS